MTESKTEIDKHNVEDKRQYLAFLQGAIERMARNSASLKQWIIPVLALCFGAAMTSESVLLGVAGIAAISLGGAEAGPVLPLEHPDQPQRRAARPPARFSHGESADNVRRWRHQ